MKAFALILLAVSACYTGSASSRPQSTPPPKDSPIKCERRWELDPTAYACQRSGHIDVFWRTGRVATIPGTTVYDVSEAGILIAGPCMADDENAENAVCVVSPPASPDSEPMQGTVYLSAVTQSAPGFERGAVIADIGVVATNGRTLWTSAFDNMNGTEGPIDVQAALTTAGIKPAACAQWSVVEALHRDAAAFVIGFKDCRGRPVRVKVDVVDSESDRYSFSALSP